MIQINEVIFPLNLGSAVFLKINSQIIPSDPDFGAAIFVQLLAANGERLSVKRWMWTNEEWAASNGDPAYINNWVVETLGVTVVNN